MAERDLSRHERAPRGGADTWDSGPAGALLSAEFFGAAAPDTALDASLAASATVAAELLLPGALRLDSLDDSLQLATPAAASGVTFVAWVKLGVDRNDYTALFTVESAGAAQYNELVTDADGTTLAVYDHATGRLGTVGTLVVGTWHKVAIVITSGAWAAYFGTAGTPGVTQVTGTLSNVGTAAYNGVGGSQAQEWLNGALARVRVWNAALSAAEVAAEFTSDAPVRTANLHSATVPPAVTVGTALTATSGSNLADGTGGGAPAYTIETGPRLDPASIALDASLAGSAALSAELTTGAASLTASLAGAATVAAQLTTAIVLTSAPSSSATLAATLTTAIRPTAALSGSAALSAQLSTSIALAAGLSGTATASASLTTAIRPTASLAGSGTLTADLTTAIRPSASITGTATLAASLSAGALQLDAALSGSASLSASLTTAIALQAGLVGSASSTAALTTAIRLEAALSGAAGLGAELSTAIALAASLGATAELAGELALVLLVPHYARPGELVTITVASEARRVEVVQGRASATVVTSPATAQVATPAVGVTPS